MKKLIRNARQVYEATSIWLSTVHPMYSIAHCPLSGVRCRHFCHLDKHQCFCLAWLLFPQLKAAQLLSTEDATSAGPSVGSFMFGVVFMVALLCFSSFGSRSSRCNPRSSILGVWGLLGWHISLKAGPEGRHQVEQQTEALFWHFVNAPPSRSSTLQTLLIRLQFPASPQSGRYLGCLFMGLH